MRFLVDAQLPRRLATWLNAHGHDAKHTLELPSGNATADRLIVAVADDEDRVVITKDTDFLISYLVTGAPRQLILVSIGNTDNDTLLILMERNFDAIVDALRHPCCIELTSELLVVHDG